MKNRNRVNLTVGLFFFLIFALGAWYATSRKSSKEIQTPRILEPGTNQTQKDGNYFRNKYPNQSDQAKCLDEYYATYPENKPENHKADQIYLAPPCPGVPQ